MAHSSAVEMIFTHQLEKLGYPTGDIRWSLGYCQGDGASFSGKLDTKTLGKRLCPQVQEAVWDGLPDDFELVLKRRDNRYVHENSTSLNYDAKCLEGSDVESWGGVAQKVALGQLLPLLEDEIYQTGSALAKLGYKIYEMSPYEKELVKAYQTQNFRVEIHRERETDWCLEDVFGECSLDEIIADIESERTEVASMCVKVIQIDEDGDELCELHTQYLGCIAYEKSGPVFGKGTAREVVSEAVVYARKMLNKRNRVTLKAA